MPQTQARYGNDGQHEQGFPLHRHQDADGRWSRWHFPWERHGRATSTVHALANAADPQWMNPWTVTRATGEYQRTVYTTTLVSLRRPSQFVTRSSRHSARAYAPLNIGTARPITDDMPVEMASVVRPARSVSPARATDRKFGVEIECIADKNVLQAALRAKGISCVVITDYTGAVHTDIDQWKIVPDGSVTGASTRHTSIRPLELVSPVLQGEAGLRQLRDVCDCLRSAWAQVNTSCGLHVHLDAADLDVENLKIALANWIAAQDVTDTLVSRSRRQTTQGYCKRYDPSTTSLLRDARTIDDVIIRIRDRYRTLNVMAYTRHKTLEVRQHQGSVEFPKIAAWVAFCQHMLNVALAERRTLTTEEVADRGALFEAIGLPQNTRAFLNRRAAKLAGPNATRQTRHADDLLSLEDEEQADEDADAESQAPERSPERAHL